MFLIEAKNLTVSQKNKPVLQDITTSFKSRGVYSIIGPSGSGKTFFLKTINRLIDFEKNISISGNILYNEKNIFSNSMDIKFLRKEIGMIFHRPTSFPTNIFENVAIGLKIHNPNIDFAPRVEKALKNVGLWKDLRSKLHHNASKFSLEIQQRLALARAIATDPKVILMDDPTVMMDAAATAKIESWIISAKQDYLIIIITSDLKQAARISDEILFLKKGLLIEQNRTEPFFGNPKHPMTEQYISQWNFI